MTFPGDYEDDMRLISTATDRDLDRLLAGGEAPADLEEVAAHLVALRRAAASGPNDDVSARHLRAIREAAVEAAHTAPAAVTISRRSTIVKRTKTALAGLTAAFTALMGASAGLAYAGVDLPGQAAERAFQVVGVELPNQGDDARGLAVAAGVRSVADDVRAVIEAWEGERGCEFGRAVAAAASQNRQNDGTEGPEHDPCATDEGEGGSPQGGKETGEEASAEGRARAEEAASAGKAKGAEPSAEGQDQADTASSGASSNGSGNAGDGGANKPATPGGQGTGEEKSSEGQSNTPEGAGQPENTGRP